MNWYEFNFATGKHDIVKHFPEDADPWGEYFTRISLFHKFGWLPLSFFVSEALNHVDTAQGFETKMLSPLAGLARLLSVVGRSDEARILASAISQYCQANPGDRDCSVNNLVFNVLRDLEQGRL